MKKPNSVLLLSIVIFVFSVSMLMGQTSVLRNGSFDDGLEGWTLTRELGEWNPLADTYGTQTNCVELYPPRYGFTGTLMYQNLNISDLAGKLFMISMDVTNSPGLYSNAVAVCLDYLDTSNSLHTVNVLTPDYREITFDWKQFSSTYTFPNDARKLTKLRIVALVSDCCHVIDNVNLSASGVVVGEIPEIQNLSNYEGAYGDTLTIRGINFGDNASGTGRVVTNGETNGAAIESWSGAEIRVRIQDPMKIGWLTVVSDFTESNGDFFYNVTSPYYGIRLISQKKQEVKGEKAVFLAAVEFCNGFTTDTGITFSIPEAPPGSVVIDPIPVTNRGGVAITVDTSDLSPGIYNWHLVAEEPSRLPQSYDLTLKVITVSSIQFLGYNTGEPITSLQIDKQGGPVTFGLKVNEGWAENISLNMYTEDPSLLWYMEGYGFYALQNGSTNIVVETADGFSASLPVNISFPESPSITSVTVDPDTVTNKGDQLVTVAVTGTDPGMYITNWGCEVTDYIEEWSQDNRSVIIRFRVSEGTQPDIYYLCATYWNTDQFTQYVEAQRIIPITVVNDPARGEIRFDCYNLAAPDDTFIYGLVEAYDSTSQKEREIYSCGWNFLSYLNPGTHRVRFADTWPEDSPITFQWYANSYDSETATDITVNAGETTHIDLFLPVSPPTVKATSPENGTTLVPTDSAISVDFETTSPMNLLARIDPRILNIHNFRLEDGNHNQIACEVIEGYGDVVFRPLTPLAFATTYTATVKTGVVNLFGVQMPEAYTWSFTTESNSLSDIKHLPDHTIVHLRDKICYLARPNFIYIEEPDRSSAIRLESELSIPAPEQMLKNKRVSVYGGVRTTSGGERYIQVYYWSQGVQIEEPASVSPLGINNRMLNLRMTDGLFVTAWGTVTPGSVTGNSYIITDGSDTEGILVMTRGNVNVSVGDFVIITGAAGYNGRRVIYTP